MKYTYTLLAMICISSVMTYAQPTITQSNYPVAGDGYSGIIDFTAPFTPGPSGVNQTWDFSALSPGPGSPFDYVLPSSTPPPYNATFSSSDIALNPFFGQYLYFLSSAVKFEVSGTVTDFGTPVVRPYTDPQKIITFPFTYLSTFKDTARTSNYTSSSGKHQRRILYSETKGDGYGSITLPGPVTYNNVLRIQVTSKTIDSTFLDAGNVFQTEDIYTDTNYYWVSSNYKPHLLWLSQDIASTGPPFVFAQYFSNPSAPTGITNGYDANISVYPNPAASDLTVEIDQTILKNNPNISFCLVNATGYEVIPCKKILSDKVNISRETVPSGIYFYKIVSEGKILRGGKISIQ